MVGSPQCMKNAQNNKTKNIIETTTAIKQLISHGELVEPFKNLFKISADWIQSLPRKKREKKKKLHCSKLSGDLYKQGKYRNIIVEAEKSSSCCLESWICWGLRNPAKLIYSQERILKPKEGSVAVLQETLALSCSRKEKKHTKKIYK